MQTSDVTDTQWERLHSLLPPQKPRTGRPAKDHRAVLNGILWVLRTGSPWRALPERYGSWKTVSSRFYRWQRAGVWDEVLAELQRRADAEGLLDWSLHFVDSTVVRAHQHAAGAKGGTRRPKRWDAAGAGTARSFICAASGAASRWSCCSRRGSGTSSRCCRR
jgi:transposase